MTEENNKKWNAPEPDPWPVKFFAHKGGFDNNGDQNTIEAFIKAVENGAPCLEMDVWNINGKLKIGHDKRDAEKKKAPILKDVIDNIAAKIKEPNIFKPVVNIELKGRDTGELAAELIKNYVYKKEWKYTDFLISAFTRKYYGKRFRLEELYKLRKKSNRIPIGLIVIRNELRYHLRYLSELKACSLHTDNRERRTDGKDKLTESFVEDAHERNIKVYPWHVNTYKDMNDVVYRKKADGFITDYIDRAKEFYSKKQC